ncbi:MAG: sulfite exporter TauE/SafE family protein [Oscillospiraceae bacterium]|nr:sulfite exporter TauE/SafE family protein [Oscillospiraceae bacterium]
MEISAFLIIMLILVSAGAAFVARVSGFGSGIFAMLFLPYLFGDTITAAAVSGLWSAVTAIANAIKYRKSVQFKLIWPIIIPAMILLTLSLQLSMNVPTGAMMVVLGIVLILLSLYFLFFSHRIQLKASIPVSITVGSVGGILSGLFSTGGPPIVLYLSSILNDKILYFATIQCYFAITDIYGIINRVLSGIITWKVLLFAAIGWIGSYIGNQLGTLVFDRLDGAKIKKIIYIGMIISGILMILK